VWFGTCALLYETVLACHRCFSRGIHPEKLEAYEIYEMAEQALSHVSGDLANCLNVSSSCPFSHSCFVLSRLELHGF
jgi:hypothetical protein